MSRDSNRYCFNQIAVINLDYYIKNTFNKASRGHCNQLIGLENRFNFVLRKQYTRIN